MKTNSIEYFQQRRKDIYYCALPYFSVFFYIFFHSTALAHSQVAVVDSLKIDPCPSQWIPFTENKCVRISSGQNYSSFLNYEQAEAYCKSLSNESRLISFSNNEAPLLLESLSNLLWKLAEAKIVNNLLAASFLTSGLREGFEWLWTHDRVALDVQPVGNEGGRCVALTFTPPMDIQAETNSTVTSRLRMVDVDCTQANHFAVCELNFAVNCTPQNGQYEGSIATSSSGMACLQWTDPLITHAGYFCPQQKLWKHNYCRNLNNSAAQQVSRPWCMVSPTSFQECDVPFCKTDPKPVVSNHANYQPCAKGELRCGFSEQCLRSEYWCDYEVDCNNGFDEAACADYLQYFELVGQYKLVDKVTEIWTNIPHAQSCAKRCLGTPNTNTTFYCESFSYEASKELCMLSQQSNDPAVIFEKTNSFYYQRSSASGSWTAYTLHAANNVVVVKKGRMEAPICLDFAIYSNVESGLARKLCHKAGYGLPIYPRSTFNGSQTHSPSQLSNSAHYYRHLPLPVITDLATPNISHLNIDNHLHPSTYWTVDCLNSPNCTSPIQPKDNQPSCQHFLSCSTCDTVTQFACQSTHQCVDSTQVCDGKTDCSDESDESGCAGPLKWSIGSGDTERRVQLRFHGELGDVCMDGLQDSEQIHQICSEIIGAKSRGRIVPIGMQTPTVFTWHVTCDDTNSTLNSAKASSCRIARISKCIAGILNLKCQESQLDTCGQLQSAVSKGSTTSKAKTRVARIVGGFNTRPGQSPWTAAIKLRLGNAHHCGAAIIAPRFLLTAAHCFQEFKEAKDFLIVAGDWDNGVEEGVEQRHNLAAIHFYPQYNQDLFQHDIAILELADSAGIRYTNVSQPICLPPRGFQYVEGEVCTVTGWGSTTVANDDSVDDYPRRMQAARLPILNKDLCKNVSKTYAAVGATSFCAGYLANGGVDSCQGDSGGPFACFYNGHFYLAGIISWGEGCAQKDHPGIYTMLTPYLSWIENITKTIF